MQAAEEKAIKVINLNDKSLREAAQVEALVVNPLRNNPSINKLLLSRTHLRGLSLVNLLKQITGHIGISIINIKENALGGRQDVFGLLVDSFPNLQELDLNDTQLDKNGLLGISESLQRLQTFAKLSRLDIGFNKLGDNGVMPFLEAIAEEPKSLSFRMWDLRMPGNLLTNKTADLLIRLITEDRLHFKYLLVDNNPKITQNRLDQLKALTSPATVVSPKQAASLDRTLLTCEFENKLLSFSEDFLQKAWLESKGPLNPALLVGAFENGIESLKVEEIRRAGSYLQGRYKGKAFDEELAEVTRWINGRCEIALNRQTLITWFENPEQTLTELGELKTQSTRQYDSAQEKLRQHDKLQGPAFSQSAALSANGVFPGTTGSASSGHSNSHRP